MSTFNVAILVPAYGGPTLEHSVAVALEPYRYDKWTWYTIVGNYGGTDLDEWPAIAAVVMPEDDWPKTRWIEPPEANWQAEYTTKHDQIAIVRCKV